MADVTELRVAMTVSDFETAIAFYRDALGLSQLADWSSDDGRVVLLEAGRATLEILDEAQAIRALHGRTRLDRGSRGSQRQSRDRQGRVERSRPRISAAVASWVSVDTSGGSKPITLP